MKLRLDALNLEAAIYNYAKELGKEGTKRLAEKLAEFVKSNIPTLSAYGQANAQSVPHPYRAKQNEIKSSTTVVESKKYDDSYLVNIRDWRAHFMEFDTQPHDRKPHHAKRMHFLNSATNKVYATARTLHHPGTKGAGVFEKAADKSVVEKYVREIAAELGSTI